MNHAILSLTLLVLLAPAVSAQDAAKGQAAFEANKCAMCHGKDAKGKKPETNIVDEESLKKSDEDLKGIVEKGVKNEKGFMPAYAGKLDAGDVVAYLRSLAQAAPASGEAAAAVDGAALYKKCQMCHGAKGALKNLDISKDDAALTAAIKDGVKPKMPAFAKLSEEEIKAVVAHLRALAKPEEAAPAPQEKAKSE